VRHAIAIAACLWLSACGTDRPDSVRAETVPVKLEPAPPMANAVRATGLLRAVRVLAIQVPQLAGQGGRITLVKLTPNGSSVKQGDTIAEFDSTKQEDDALEAQAKFEDLGHQVKQKQAQNRSDAEQRMATIQQAIADRDKAMIQLRKGAVLAEIDRLKNEAAAEGARARVASLQKSHELRLKAEAASLRILELQQQRQKVAWDRAVANQERLKIKAPLAGMVVLENIWKGGTMGHAQEGDQLWTGQPLMKIFDPAEMEVHAQVGEPDGAVLHAGTKAWVKLDAYPDATFSAEFVSASPVATAALGSPIKNFAARFRLLGRDARLLPDLAAAVVIER
jgi:multidrug resistance efflux pump